MLTQTRNKHFSERLFYADSLPQAAHACYNGNLSAAQSTYGNFEQSFAYFYDALNRLTESKQLVLNLSTTNSERFAYDDAGNIISLKRYVLARVIDNLTYSYGDEGNQLLSVTDNGQDLDLYGVVEYHNSESKPDTTMRYDANGNLVYDLDRGISVIRYNILNLPDTIQFINGNQIVNHYDAVGRKYRSITYTVDATTFTPHYSIEHYTFDTDTVQPMVMEHAGNIDNRYTRYDTTRVIYNAIGYCSGGAYYHYIKDHLGNICAVINSTADTLVQSTAYYASGVPMGVGISRDAQPYLYNSKEFVQDHGLNTYDYGFRGYYTVIGRFTTPDPLAEQTPWLSPYSYAGNNFINAIDWMGLSGRMAGVTHTDDMPHYIVINSEGIWIGGVDDGDRSIYVDELGTWSESHNKDMLRKVGHMIMPFAQYVREALASGGRYRVPGAYYRQLSIHAVATIGFQVQLTSEFGVVLPAWDIIDATYTYDDSQDVFNFAYFGQKGKAHISIGFDVYGISYDYSLSYYLKSGDYVYGTWSNTLTFSIFDKFSSFISPDGYFNLNFSIANILGFNVSISGNIYYEQGSDIP